MAKARKNSDFEIPENPTVFQASKMRGLLITDDEYAHCAALHVLQWFFGIPDVVIARDLQITKGRLSQIRSGKQVTKSFKIKVHHIAWEAVAGYKKMSGYPGGSGVKILEATVQAATALLNKEAVELGLEPRKGDAE